MKLARHTPVPVALLAWPHGALGHIVAALLFLQWLPLAIVSIDDNWCRSLPEKAG
jgi:hypothetical protein